MALLDVLKEIVQKVHESPEKALALIQYLRFFGYVAKDGDVSLEEILTAVKKFQEVFGINETGIGPKTLRAMEWPRCAVPEAFEVESASSPRKWGINKLGYFIKKRDSDISPAEWDAAIARSLNSWSEVTNLDFYRVDSESAANLVLDVGVGRADDFDGPSGTLAWYQLPPSSNFKGRLYGKFDAGETWVTDRSKRGIVLEHVSCHEIGHGLGLNHSSRQGALMAPYYSVNIAKPQPVDDIPRIQSLYGKRTTQPAPQPEPKPDPKPTPVPVPGKLVIEIAGQISSFNIPGYRVIKVDD